MGEAAGPPIRVMIVDDSAAIRSRLREVIASDSSLELVAEATDPFQAREPFLALRPDVVILDLEMPGMNGMKFLAKIMDRHPTGVIVFSGTLDDHIAAEALEHGASSVISKPNGIGKDTWAAKNPVLVRAIHRAAEMPIPTESRDLSSTSTTGLPTVPMVATGVICIGASTGGPEAIAQLLERWPRPTPPVVIAVHMAAPFTSSFTQRLDSLVKDRGLQVRVASQGAGLLADHIFVAPGDHHVRIDGKYGRWTLAITNEDPIRHHRPSVDALFLSAAESVGGVGLGILLTGMGDDGAQGLKAMRDRGAHTIAQDEESCVVFGMPQQAIRLEAAAEVAHLAVIPEAVQVWIHRTQTGIHPIAPRK